MKLSDARGRMNNIEQELQALVLKLHTLIDRIEQENNLPFAIGESFFHILDGVSTRMEEVRILLPGSPYLEEEDTLKTREGLTQEQLNLSKDIIGRYI